MSLSKLTCIVSDAQERRFIRLQSLIDIKVWHLLIWGHPIHFNLSVQSSETCWTLHKDPAGSDQIAPSCAQNLTTLTAAAALLLSKNRAKKNPKHERGLVWSLRCESRLLIPQNKAECVLTWAEEEQEQSWDGEQPHGPLTVAARSNMRGGGRAHTAAHSRAWWASTPPAMMLHLALILRWRTSATVESTTWPDRRSHLMSLCSYYYHYLRCFIWKYFSLND